MPLATLTYLPHVRQSSKPALPRPIQEATHKNEATPMQYLGRLIKDIRFSSFAVQGTEPRSHSKHGSPQDSYHTQAKTL